MSHCTTSFTRATASFTASDVLDKSGNVTGRPSAETKPPWASFDSNKTGSMKRSFGLSPSSIREAVTEIKEQASPAAYVAIIVAMMGAIMFGIDCQNYGLASGFQSFYDDWCMGRYNSEGFNCTPKDDAGNHNVPKGWTHFKALGGSLITLGAAAGCIALGPVVTSNCGRRPCISLGGFMCFVGCLFASHLSFNNVYVFYAGRFITGFGVGIACFALPLYSSEVSTPSIRGIMGSLFQLLVVAGTVVASVMLAFVTDWKVGMLMPGVAGVIVGIAIWFIPESPRFVLDKYGYDAGKETLQKVRKGNVDQEILAMQQDSERQREIGTLSYGQLFSNPSIRKRLFIACYLQIAQQLTGVNAFLSYENEIFKGAGVPVPDIGSVAIGFSLLQIVGCLVGLSIVDSKYGGRRSQLLAASVFMGVPLVIAGIGKLLNWPSIISIVSISIFGFAFQYAWGLVPWLYPAEIFSMSEKDKALSLSTFMNFAVNFVVAYITPSFLAWSPGGTFIIFGILNVSNFVFVVLFIKETKGIPLENVPALFERRAVSPELLNSQPSSF